MNSSSSACVTVTDDTISASASIDTGCTIFGAGKEFAQRVARSGGVEQQLAVDDVYGGVIIGGAEREHAHTGAELEVDHVRRAADADNQIGGAEGAGDGRKREARFE